MSLMQTWTRIGTVLLALAVCWTPLAVAAADDSAVKDATRQVESGANKIGEGKVIDGAAETATGIGHTVVEGAKFTGEKLKESGRAAEPPAKSAWEKVRGGAYDFGQSVKNFFTRLFNN